MSDNKKATSPTVGSATIKITKPAPTKANRPPSPATRAAIRRSLALDTIAKSSR